MKQLLFCLLTCCMSFVQVWGFLDEPPCYEFLQRHFFQQDIVKRALSLHNMPQGHWQVIVDQLQTRSQTVPTLLHKRAEQMMRNPLAYPFQDEESRQLLLEVLWEIFSAVMRESNFAKMLNPNAIRDMFNFIERAQEQNLSSCMPKKNNKK